MRSWDCALVFPPISRQLLASMTCDIPLWKMLSFICFFTFSQCCVSDFSLWNACQVFWSWLSLDNHFSLWSLLSSFFLQRPIRGRHSNLRSNWRKSPKWRKHWAQDHPPSPRARSSQASLRLSAQTGQRWLQQPQIAQGRWNQEKEAPWLRTACWARISTLRLPLSCWLSFQVGCLLIYRTVEMQNELYSSQIGLCNNWHSSVPLNLCKTLTLWSSNILHCISWVSTKQFLQTYIFKRTVTTSSSSRKEQVTHCYLVIYCTSWLFMFQISSGG